MVQRKDLNQPARCSGWLAGTSWGGSAAWRTGKGAYDRAMQLSDHAFRKLVDQALDQVPEEFRSYLKDLPVVIEGWPSDELLASLGVPEDGTLYGLYSGHPITAGPPGSGELPPRITIFRAPLLEDCEDEAELRDEVTTTVLHEIAHHFGIGEARLEELGWG
jgi:predicted Zn-dependent protease with MMP-like domain